MVGADVLGGRVAVYRRADGAPVVLSAYCPHMGADLAGGEVHGDDLRCMFHFFRFGPDGALHRHPVRGQRAQPARVHSFPVAERWGLVWMFNGAEPLFEVRRACATTTTRTWSCGRAAPTCSRSSRG